jgi:hypothetical protein
MTNAPSACAGAATGGPAALHDGTTARRHDVFKWIFLENQEHVVSVVSSCLPAGALAKVGRRDSSRRLVSAIRGLSFE